MVSWKFGSSYSLLLVVVAAVAIYVQVTSSTLSLPLSTGTTALTIVLPFLAAINFFITPQLRSLLGYGIRASPILQFVPFALQIFQGVLTAVLATLAAQGFVPGQLLDCGLEGRWQGLWHNRDGHAIERIQETLGCCGLRSTVDRDWPPAGCKALYKDRHTSCLGPWRATMQRSAGFEFAIVVAVGVLQLVSLALFRLDNNSSRNFSRSASTGYARIPQNVGPSQRSGLIEPGMVDDDDSADEAENNSGSRNNQGQYGSLEDGPRIAPSGLGESDNQWRSA